MIDTSLLIFIQENFTSGSVLKYQKYLRHVCGLRERIDVLLGSRKSRDNRTSVITGADQQKP